MIQSVLNVDGIDVLIEGDGPETVLMIHGWPDTCALWDSTVASLKERERYRCVRFTLPGFDLALPPRTLSLQQITALIGNIANSVSPQRPVTLLLHDWGCIFGYEFAARNPARVARIAAVDIGDYNSAEFSRSLSTMAKLQIFLYQFWLALAWKAGGTLGDRMTRWMAGAMRCPNAPAKIACQMNYPYAMQWFGLHGGFRQALPVAPVCPLLYFYGARKPFMFHTPAWLAQLSARPGCEHHGFATGHWVMVEQPAEFTEKLVAWLDAAVAPAPTIENAASVPN